MSAKSGPKPDRRLQFAPIERLMIGDDDDMRTRAHKHDSFTSDRVMPGHMALVLGVSLASIARYRAQGIPMRKADEFAIRLGVHPIELWSDFYADVEAA